MGLMDTILGFFFGDSAQKTIEIFKENSERSAERSHNLHLNTLQQFQSEFSYARRGWFGRVVDGLNRLPRPIMAFGVIGLFASAMSDPLWFASRMQGLAMVPEPLWWLLGAIISFYFGARHQAKGQQFQRDLLGSLDMVPQVQRNLMNIDRMRHSQDLDQSIDTLALTPSEGDNNPALDDWRRQ